MNSLILTLDAGAGCCLPIAYQQLTQGALYAAWRGSYPQLHDEGFAGDGQTFRLFTFGPLEGRYRVQGNEITFTGLVQLEVRSPVEDLLYALGKSLTGAGALRLGRCVLPLRDLRSDLRRAVKAYDDDTDRRVSGSLEWRESDSTRVRESGYYEFVFDPSSSRYDSTRDDIYIRVN